MGASCSTAAINLAAGDGHLDIVKWLHENRSEGCTSYAINFAARNGHDEIVKYLIENGIESDMNVFHHSLEFAKAAGRTEIASYLESVLK